MRATAAAGIDSRARQHARRPPQEALSREQNSSTTIGQTTGPPLQCRARCCSRASADRSAAIVSTGFPIDIEGCALATRVRVAGGPIWEIALRVGGSHQRFKGDAGSLGRIDTVRLYELDTRNALI